MKKTHLLGFPISQESFNGTIDRIIELARRRESSSVCIANVHMFVEARRRQEFMATIKTANIVTPDGLPLTWGLKLLKGIRQERVAGADLLPHLLKQLENQCLKPFFLGGTEQMLAATQCHLEKNFPKLSICGMYSPPFRPFTDQELDKIVEMINLAEANLVFVILGCPKQETLMDLLKGRVNAVMVGIGGALPVIIGLQPRAPKVMRRAGFEWLFRLYLEPKRLAKRYLITNSVFLFCIIKEFILASLKTSSTASPNS